jgi:thiamine biosynthesis lipoprotein
METLAFRAMNTSILFAVDGDNYAALGLQEARSFIQMCERRFSRFLSYSEVFRLNDSAGQWTNVSDDLLDMLERARFYHKETHGLFDPSILPDLKRLGYDRSMDEIRADGESSAQTSASNWTSRPALASMEIDHPNKRVRLPHGMEIDLGGIAKGWIVEKTADLLSKYSEVCAVNAGGDMVFIGQPLDGFGWDVQLEDPREPSQSLAALRVRSGAVATSSISKRTWKQNGNSRHHIVDPRTGEPAVSNWLSVTVFAPDLVKAEVYAKSILIGGEGESAELLAGNPDIAYIAVDQNGNLSGSNNSKEYLYEHEFNYR